MIRGVIFDLGETLIYPGDFETGNAQSLLRWLRARGHPVEDGFLDAMVGERRALWAGRDGTREVTADQALRTVLERYRLPSSPEFLADTERAFFAAELDGMRPVPGAVEILARLNRRGMRTALISNASSHYLIVECCRRLLFTPYLEPIVTSAAVGWAKPDPRVFQAVLRPWGTPPEQIVMVGDTLGADIAGARMAQMRSILVTATHPPGAPTALDSLRPDAVAGDLREVGEIIERWRRED